MALTVVATVRIGKTTL